MTEQDALRRLLVLAGPADHQIAVSELAESGELVVDDLTEGVRIGDLNGDVQPLLLTIEGKQYIVFGGEDSGAWGCSHDFNLDQAMYAEWTEGLRKRHGDNWLPPHVEVTSPGPTPAEAFTQTAFIKRGVWLTFPEPFRDGMEATFR